MLNIVSLSLLHIDKLINSLLKVEYPFLDCNKYMGQVYNPKDWRAHTMEGSGCAFISCQNRPTSQCPQCSNYCCFEHSKTHEHGVNPNSIQKEIDDPNKMR